MSTPFELWKQSGGDREKYRELLKEHGLLVPRCAATTVTTQRRCSLEKDHFGPHDFINDIFGHRRK